ncbi:hypothetical protein D3C87_676330 [compost metagenome]
MHILTFFLGHLLRFAQHLIAFRIDVLERTLTDLFLRHLLESLVLELYRPHGQCQHVLFVIPGQFTGHISAHFTTSETGHHALHPRTELTTLLLQLLGNHGAFIRHLTTQVVQQLIPAARTTHVVDGTTELAQAITTTRHCTSSPHPSTTAFEFGVLVSEGTCDLSFITGNDSTIHQFIITNDGPAFQVNHVTLDVFPLLDHLVGGLVAVLTCLEFDLLQARVVFTLNPDVLRQFFRFAVLLLAQLELLLTPRLSLGALVAESRRHLGPVRPVASRGTATFTVATTGCQLLEQFHRFRMEVTRLGDEANQGGLVAEVMF